MTLVGIIGPSKGYDAERVRQASERLSDVLLNTSYDVLINPMTGGSPELFGRIYSARNESHLVGVTYPLDGICEEYLKLAGEPFFNIDICERTIHCDNCEEHPKVIVQKSKHLIVLGLSGGVNWEISLTKRNWRMGGEKAPNPDGKVFIIDELIEGRYPPELDADLGIEYISLDNLTGLGNTLRGQ